MDELVDIVDGNDHVIGSSARAALAEGMNHRVVHVLVIDGMGRLWLQRPSLALGKPFELGSSVAGHVRAGESYAAAAAREFREELGLASEHLVHLGTTFHDEAGRRKFVGVFIVREDREPRPDPGEVASIERMSLNEVRHLLRARSARFSSTFARAFQFADAAGGFDLV